jgi:hypothetical protein
VIDGGIILMLMGAIVGVVAPAQDTIAYRRWQNAGADTDPTIDPRIAGIAEIYRRG